MIFRAFTLDDQKSFAKLSGDNNPLHTDVIAARRTMFGSPVVHGIHGVLRALDYLLVTKDESVELSRLKAIFYKPIKVGDELEMEVAQQEDASMHIRLLSSGAVVTKVIVAWEDVELGSQEGDADADFPTMIEPRVLSDEELAVDSGTLDLSLNIEAASILFPALVKRMRPREIATIMHLSRLVGVYCPGLHSLFLEVELTRVDSHGLGGIYYEVERFDKRVGLLNINVTAPYMTGFVKAFRRPQPKEQEGYLSLKQRVSDDEFSNQKALIIGGSRGLGEVAAKMLAAGGADVKITYHHGKADAEKVVADIVSNGGLADCFQYDVLNPAISQEDISLSGWQPTHLYYFATPFIFSGVRGKFSPDLFRKFCDYYVVGFANVLSLLGEHEIKRVFYPSTVAIDELPKHMGEYSSAKIASELLCDFFEKCDPQLVIYKSRFPRLATDQTVSILPVKNEDPAELLISELRAFNQKMPSQPG